MGKALISFVVLIGVVLMVLAISALAGLVFQLLWNFVSPVWWAQAPVLTFYQAWASMVLFAIFLAPLKYEKRK